LQRDLKNALNSPQSESGMWFALSLLIIVITGSVLFLVESSLVVAPVAIIGGSLAYYTSNTSLLIYLLAFGLPFAIREGLPAYLSFAIPQ
jgi:hypothetical protein